MPSLTTQDAVAELAPPSQSVLIALAYRNLDAVRAAVAARRGIEQRDPEGETPLLLAATTGQYRAARILVENGANIWVINEFGRSLGRTLELTKLPPDSIEGRERVWLLNHLRSQGFPFPAADGRTVLAMQARGEWPPRVEAPPRP